jgi:hypothetical protein
MIADKRFKKTFLRLPNLEGRVPVFISPRNRVVEFVPRGAGLQKTKFTAPPLLQVTFCLATAVLLSPA